MADTKPKPTAKNPTPDDLRTECVDILTEYLDALHAENDKNPSEQNVPDIQTAQAALALFTPQQSS